MKDQIGGPMCAVCHREVDEIWLDAFSPLASTGVRMIARCHGSEEVVIIQQGFIERHSLHLPAGFRWGWAFRRDAEYGYKLLSSLT